jgi:hypothetical protein
MKVSYLDRVRTLIRQDRWGATIKIVLVYLGKIPRYVLANAVYLTETFPNHEVLVITDSVSEVKNLDSRGIASWVCSDVRESWSKVSKSSSHNNKFRGDFWFKTVARFYALYEFSSLFPHTPILHVEADVWLSPNFPLDILESLKGKIAYPLKSPSEGIASTLYISDLSALHELITFCEKSFTKNPLSTDVTILGSFYRAFSGKFESLPTLPKGSEILRDSNNHELSDLLSANFEKYSGIFDASTLGIHYTGIDPRNNWGIRTLFKTPDAPMDLRKANFMIIDKLPYLENKGILTQIYSLHVHSKDEQLFHTNSYLKRLIKISSFSQLKTRHELSGFRSLFILGETFIIRSLIWIRNSARGAR